ncbi:MAG: enoyl-CoA hydratase [Burkholderiaceae bacterium]
MNDDPVILEIRPAEANAPGLDQPASVAWLTINRAAKSNALNPATMSAFVAAVKQAAEDDTVRALVVTGAGDRAFVAGADIATMGALDEDTAREFITAVHHCCDAVRLFPAPVIARMNGVAFGAGLELAAACDIRIAADDIMLGMPEVKLGIPSVVEAALLPGLIGWGRTREILLLGDNFDAHRAEQWGLINRVVPRATLDEQVDEILTSLLANGPQSVRAQKALMTTWEQLPLAQAITAGIDKFAASWQTDEPTRMLRAWRR